MGAIVEWKIKYLTNNYLDNDAKIWKPKEVESIEVLSYPFYPNEDIDIKGFS